MANGNLTPLASFIIFVGIPAVVLLILVAFILAPAWTRAGRYRPGEPWEHEPVLINAALSGPVTDAEEFESAAAVAELDAPVVGEEMIMQEIPELASTVPGSGGEGGVSARW